MQKFRIMRIIIGITLIVLVLSGIASSGWVEDQITKIPEHFARFILDMMIHHIKGMLVWIKDMLMWNPDPDDIKPIVDDSIEILIPIYVMVITLTGIYVLFLSISPAGRARAKSMLWNLILSMVLVSLSLEIFKILLNISGVLTRRIIAGIVTTNLSQLIGLGEMNPWMLFFLYIFIVPVLFCAVLAVALRYIIVLILCAIFPFTLFLYFFEFTKDIGSKLLRYTMAAIYTQVVQALMLAITVISINSVVVTGLSTNANIIYGLLIVAGGLMIALAPLMMMGLLTWVGGALAGIGMVVSFKSPIIGGAMVAAGGVASGMGAGGLIAGGTAYGLGRAYIRASPVRQQKIERKRERREERRFKKERKEEKRLDKKLARRGVPHRERKKYAEYYERARKAQADKKQKTLSDYGEGAVSKGRGRGIKDYFKRRGRAAKEYFTGGKARGAGRSMEAQRSDTDAVFRAKDEKGYLSMKKEGVRRQGLIKPSEEPSGWGLFRRRNGSRVGSKEETGTGRGSSVGKKGKRWWGRKRKEPSEKGGGRPEGEGGRYGAEYRDWEGEKREPKEWENLDKKQEFRRPFKSKEEEKDYWRAYMEIKQQKISDVEIPKGRDLSKLSDVGIPKGREAGRSIGNKGTTKSDESTEEE